MNKTIQDFLDKSLEVPQIPQFLPHQIATVDFLYKQIIKEKKNVLLFHKMGSGKTIISLLFAFYVTKTNNKVFIVLPNVNIKQMWEHQLSIVLKLLPFDEYNIKNIHFITKKTFIADTDIIKTSKTGIVEKYKNSVVIIDEGHNFLNNQGSQTIFEITSFFRDPDLFNSQPLFLLVTGSPITNTVVTLKDLIDILLKNQIDIGRNILNSGKRVFNISLDEEGTDLLENVLDDQISFFNQGLKNSPAIKFMGKPVLDLPIIQCPMSVEQSAYYDKNMQEGGNEMFLKNLLNSSFTAMTSYDIGNFDAYVKGAQQKKLTLTPNLHFYNGHFQGEELQSLKNSAKIKYFVDECVWKRKPGKRFIYFVNSTLGGYFLRDVMKAIGIQEYNGPPIENFICFFCGKDRTCEKCKPLTYIMITSILISNSKESGDFAVNSLINAFNSSSNEDGSEIQFLFGSKLLSESYTLKEVKEIWFLTIPDSKSEMDQIIARAIRNFSYKDITQPVNIYLLVAVPNKFKLDPTLKNDEDFKEQLTQDNNKFPYDLKKILYLEIKSIESNKIHSLFEKKGKGYHGYVQKNLEDLCILEMLRRFSYSHSRFSIREFQEMLHASNIFENEITIEHICQVIKNHPVVNNDKFGECLLAYQDNECFCAPLMFSYNKHILQIAL
ncbi:putative viral early transcription factor small subunit [Diachasmimorpha longicaudata entomopoxvirus]|uniref:Putative viral early transcription factor small subunit n=1 Tax=Diachasmimorpha longicaudata entomopoxvirus TaxID=109981 RepID=A0A7R5WF24_9POXV|nr:putative viral early transcription factor small subunit [Diachasmimorpha longicaudata entomopoxvirus]AKS26315.1 putative viral early transcription factor small subunit [Diachasmimorpha longicaudata entomopoxvirus]